MLRDFRSPNTSNDVQRHLKETEVAERLELSTRTLQGWRLKGEGPSFLKFGRSVRYAESTLEMWVAACERGSTSATGPVDLSNIHQSNILSHSLQGDRS